MAYEPNTWKSGDIVTSAKMNHIEEGIANAGPLVVEMVREDTTATIIGKTAGEILDAMKAGQPVVVTEFIEDELDIASPCVYCGFDGDAYFMAIIGYLSKEPMEFSADGPDENFVGSLA